MAESIKKTADDYTNSINETIAIHVKKAIEGLSFNKTELVEIVDITNRDQGKYIVWNGAIRYIAYSKDTDYKIGNKVYVNIPNNDYKGEKTIIGIYHDGSATQQNLYDYKLPFTTFSKTSENLLPGVVESSLLANCNKEVPETGSQSQGIVSITESNKGSKYLGVAANFRAMLGDNVEGDYGLKFNIIATDENGEQADRVYYLRSSENMVGNIYNFSSYIQQQARFDIDGLRVSRIDVEFFQAGNFKDETGSMIPWQYQEQLLLDNISVKDIEIYYGIDVPTTEDILEIYTDNSQTYNSINSQEENLKTLRLKWTYTDLTVDEPEAQIITSNTQALELFGDINLNVHWYKKMDNAAYVTNKEEVARIIKKDEDNLALLKRWKEKSEDYTEEDCQFIIDNIFFGDTTYYTAVDNKFTIAGEELLITLISSLEKELGPEVDTTMQTSTATTIGLRQRYYQTYENNLAGEGWYLIGDDTFVLERIEPDLDKKTTEYKAIIEYGPWQTKINDYEQEEIIEGLYDKESLDYHIVVADDFILTNIGDVADEAAAKNNAAELIFNDEGLNADYRLYDSHSGNLIDSSWASKIITVEFTCDSTVIGSYLNPSSDIVIWDVPKSTNRSMVRVLVPELENNTILDRDSDLLRKLPQIISYKSSNDLIKKEGSDKYKLQFQVAQSYRATATNNRITCYVIQPTGIITKFRDISFSQFDYTGSDYMFTLNLGKLVQPISKKNRSKVYESSELFSSNPPFDWSDVEFKDMDSQDSVLTYNYPAAKYGKCYREIEIHLYNSKNREIPLTNEEKNAIIRPWINWDSSKIVCGDNNYFQFIHMEEEESVDNLPTFYATRVAVRIRNDSPGSPTRIPPRALILRATFQKTDDDTGELIQYHQILPIPVQDGGCHLNGPTAVVYNSENSDYYTLPQSRYITFSDGLDGELSSENGRWANEEENLKKDIAVSSPDSWGGAGGRGGVAGKAQQRYREKYLEHLKIVCRIKNRCYKKLFNESTPLLDAKYAGYYYYTIDGNGGYAPKFETELLTEPTGEEGIVCEYSGLKILPYNVYVQSAFFYNLNIHYRYDTYDNRGKDERIVATLPIVILQNRFNVPGEDQWYNAVVLKVEEEKQEEKSTAPRLFAASGPTLIEKSEILKVNAGTLSENKDGKVSGALIGSIKFNDSKTDGLFGYKDNSLVFKIGTDGEAFLGKKGAGRISFSGNSGQIMSQSRVETIDSLNPIGSLFDLQSGKIELVSDKENSLARVVLSTTSVNQIEDADTDEVYFSVNDKEGHRLISIGDIETDLVRYSETGNGHKKNDIDYESSHWGNFFIKTKDFVRPGKSEEYPEGAGLRIDLSNGNFESYSDFTLMSSDNITLDGETTIRKNLYIDSDLYINGHQVQLINGAIQTIGADLMTTLYSTSIGTFPNTTHHIKDESGNIVASRGPYVERSELVRNPESPISERNRIPYTFIENLAEVAKTGDYDDLDHKPTIPDVSDYYPKRVVNSLGRLLIDKGYITAAEWDGIVN